MKSTELASDVVRMATGAGASAAEVLIREGTEFSAHVRLGAVEKLLQSNFRKLGVRLFSGPRSAIASTSDFSLRSLQAIISDTVAMAKAGSDDPASALPPEADYRRGAPSLELFFPEASRLSAGSKIEFARRCEQAALEFDPRINNSEGAEFSDSLVDLVYANSLGILEGYSKTSVSLYTTPLAELGGQKQRDYWLSTALDLGRLDTPEGIGREAARRTLRRLGGKRVSTCEVPVVFDPLTSAALLKHIAEAVSGTALMRKASLFYGKLGTRVASPLVSIWDDAVRPGGLGSRPFDSEGLPSQTTPVIRQGILENFLLDSYSARKLGLRSTANSNRELHAAPSAGVSNFYIQPGSTPPGDILGSVKNGLYVTELIGFGVNIVSGTYSQGAAGSWILNGEPAYPVEEITIAGDLKDMLTSIEAVGNDLVAQGEIFAPTILISKMVVSGI